MVHMELVAPLLRAGLALLVLHAVTVCGQVDQNVDPLVITMVNNASIGPDGPWWYISQSVDFPDQFLPLLPSISQSSLVINASACRGQEAVCPLPVPNMLTVGGAWASSGGFITQSNLLDAAIWDADYAALLGLEGVGRQIMDRMTLFQDGDTTKPIFLDDHTIEIAENFTASYSNDAYYTMDTGFFSLYGAEEVLEYESINGTTVSGNRTLPSAYLRGASPSISYSLHMGSVQPNVTGSLVLGGYDMSRCLTTPVISSSNAVELLSISLNVSSGGYAYVNATSSYTPGLLRANGSSVNSLLVYPRPGAPHLYLPQDTCDAIASHLPVTYDEALDTYLWKTDEQAYHDIISSPHSLDFSFASEDAENQTISVPFALLNLTLTSPVVDDVVQYFPCKPWTPNRTGYTLGNAFLQSALLAQNWQTKKLFLAQAPGPNHLSASVQRISTTDTTLTPAHNPPSWAESWSGTLKALPESSQGSSHASGPDAGGKSSSSLPGGTIAGIVIGGIAAAALVAGAIWYLVRKRNQRSARGQSSADDTIVQPSYHKSEGTIPQVTKPLMEEYPTETQPAPKYEMWSEREVSELPAGEFQTRVQ